ncbi:MAG: MotA/TolQ/ExbB proton channel family protein [Verrucomicrobia bacterium]|nr:MotA/TolQ/ExbB proton channel family protein [Verrucomicrobiota bacterium]
MTTRNKGILSLEFLLPNFGFLFLAALSILFFYKTVVTPRSNELMIERRVKAESGKLGNEPEKRSVYLIIKDDEPMVEIIFCTWGLMVLGYKWVLLVRERKLLAQDFLRIQPGERIIPEDALDRYKELRTAVDRNPGWGERLLPDCLLAALHRFHATASIQDASTAVRERAEIAADQLDSSLSLIRYIAWAIPAIGFVGTVRGIGESLNHAEQAIKGDISALTANLGLAFNSTFVGLMLCIILMWVLHVVQSQQESFIIETQTYCRDRLIDVMKVPTKEETARSFT